MLKGRLMFAAATACSNSELARAFVSRLRKNDFPRRKSHPGG